MIFILDFRNAAGALVGLAIGDALGAPLEGSPPPRIFRTEMRSGGVHGAKKGQYTDDTLQAIAIAESLIACRGYCPADIMRRFVEGYRSNPRFYGPTSSAVFELVARGAAIDRAASAAHRGRGGSRTNGSVMRGAPIGIFFSPALVRPVSLACSRLTHLDPDAGECSALVNRMICELCRGAGKKAAFERAIVGCRSPEVRRILISPRRSPLVPSLDALETTHCAVSLFLETGSFEEAVVRAVNLGGDADTIGAVCGALAGSYYGINAIPRRWLESLTDSREMVSLALRLARSAQRFG